MQFMHPISVTDLTYAWPNLVMKENGRSIFVITIS